MKTAIVPVQAATPAVDIMPADTNPALVYLASLGRNSRSTMTSALQKIAQLLGASDMRVVDWAAIRFQHATALRSQLASQYSADTTNRMLAALRGTLRAAWKLEMISAEDYQRAISVKNVIGETLPAGRALTSGEIVALLEACMLDPSPAGARDAAILALLRACGLRRAEACTLTVADYVETDGALKVRGKRNKERLVYLAGGAKDALEDWLAVRGTNDGPIFVPVDKGGSITRRQMDPKAIFNMLRKRAAQANVTDLSPHDLRRTFVSDLLDAGADIATVQKLAGHSSVNTTARYDRRPEEAKRKALSLLHVPYRRRERT